MCQSNIFHPVFEKHFFHAALLGVITVAVAYCYALYLVKLNTELQRNFEVTFITEIPIELASGPVWFYYSKSERKIYSSKSISNEDKSTLLSLYPKDTANLSTYTAAVNELAYKSNKKSDEIFILLLTLGSLGGILGVMIRSISSFIHHSCFLKDIRMDQWWPWYCLRPVMGAGLGIVIIVLSQSQLLTIEAPGELTGFWILGICILAGFAASEVTDRFYFAAKALFGGQT